MKTCSMKSMNYCYILGNTGGISAGKRRYPLFY